MPAFANDGATIVICSGITGELIEIQLDSQPSDHNDTDSSKCSYSVFGAYTGVSTPILARLETSYIRINTKIEAALTARYNASSNQTRGPPLISLI